ncbi:MAG: diguanylate cyclase [Candidatus Omnitrophica bacterium]|nr:diguanylate cyclase [Candidatus Omnitrophota bacterium]
MKKILLVDEDEQAQAVVESRLGSRGYQVFTVNSREDAIHLIERETVDLILLSADMDRSTSEGVIEHIRKRAVAYLAPVVMLTRRDHVARLILAMQKGFDDFLTKPLNPLELQLRVDMNIGRAESRVQLNPLTKLPGNVAIEKELWDKIKENRPFSVCYIDIDNFKSFNDAYSYERGDVVIKQTARILAESIRKFDPDNRSFLGHVGGDDFIAIIDPDIETAFAKNVIGEFDRIIPTFYTNDDQQKGYVEVKNRRGQLEKFPLMTVSIAAVTNLYRKLTNPGEIAQFASELKRYLKTQKGSIYLRDRREQQMDKIDEALNLFFKEGTDTKEENSEEPLGQVLLAAGLIDDQELSEALKKHFETGQRLGQVLVAMNLVKSEDVGRMLEKKLGVPYCSLKPLGLDPSVATLFTADFARAHRLAPVRLEGKKLFLAMVDPFDIKVIDNVERITGYYVVPLLALEDEFEIFVEKHFQKETV